MKKKINIGIVGNVNSTRITFQKLIQYNANIVLSLALDPTVSKSTSGYFDISEIAQKYDIPCQYFKKINTPEIVEIIKKAELDILFIVGFSQLIRKEIIDLPKIGCIGFHPTKLPKGRGRAPVAWIILEKIPTAATFFMIDEGTDSGNIIVQENYYVSKEDYARDVINEIAFAIEKGLDRILPELIYGKFDSIKQNHEQATYFGKRNLEDGFIDWNESADSIYSLIRAASEPHPGAFTFTKKNKFKITKAKLDHLTNYKGTIGSILVKDSMHGLLVQTGNGLLWITQFENYSIDNFKVGQKFISYQAHLLNSLILQNKKEIM